MSVTTRPGEHAHPVDPDQRWRAMLDPITQASPERPYVVAQLGQSVDGRIATLSGESRWINGDGALDHLHRLRASVDAVVVGIGTALADDPILNVRRVPGAHPARVVIDPSGRLSREARCLADDGTRRLVIHAEDAAPLPRSFTGIECITCARTDGRLSPRGIVDALFVRGLKRVLVEGGAWTVSAFIDAGMVDRLHLLVAPIILGSGKPGLTLEPIAKLADAKRPHARIHVLGETDVLFDCDLRSDRKGD
jgi:diaminohydroxyphosphoribosylaminopyrimidine deaminase / 5-amino-6-(5-phosphoribosylamino)uracil reductase